MKFTRTCSTCCQALTLVLLVATFSPGARAESWPESHLAFGWQTENAHAVLLARVVSEVRLDQPRRDELTIETIESIRGPLRIGDCPVVVVRDVGHGRPWKKGATHLVFIRRLPGVEGAPVLWTPLTGPFGFRRIEPATPSAAFPGIVRSIAATLDDDGSVEKPDVLRDHLVAWAAHADAGVALSAALDLVRHASLHDALTAAQRGTIVRAFAERPFGSRAKHALALAAAATRTPEATTALVASLASPDADPILSAVEEAFRRFPSASAEGALISALGATTKPTTAHLRRVTIVLGSLGDDDATEPLAKLLTHAEPALRAEAAHALGRVARNVRAADQTDRIDARSSLETMLSKATTRNEIRAALWALAQLDEAEAYAVLRRLVADDSTPEETRRYARRLLARPRQSLVLR